MPRINRGDQGAFGLFALLPSPRNRGRLAQSCQAANSIRQRHYGHASAIIPLSLAFSDKPLTRMGAMANPKHVGLLKLDVQAWNAWRRKNPDGGFNLAGAS